MRNLPPIRGLRAQLKLLDRIIQNLEHLAKLRQDPARQEVLQALTEEAGYTDASAARLLSGRSAKAALRKKSVGATRSKTSTPATGKGGRKH